jgi:hypothetical protein
MVPLGAALAAILMLASHAASARPVSHPGGTTAMAELNPMLASLHVHYSPSRHWSTGPRLIQLREENISLIGAQATWLVNRWNMPSSQANLYVAGMAGGATGDFQGPAGYVEAQTDWENRRVMLMGMARFTAIDGWGTGSMQMARIGWAPYAGRYGDPHLWLFAQVMRDSRMKDSVQPAFVARLFYRTFLFEAGVTDRGGAIVNTIIRF